MSLQVWLKAQSSSVYTEITDLIAEKGITWTWNSVDADGAGRSLDGVMHRKQIGVADKFEVKCRPLTSTELKSMRTLLKNQWLTAKMTDDAETVEFTCYRGATVTTAALVSFTAVQKWDGIKFSLIAKTPT